MKAGRNKIDPKLKRKSRPISLNDDEYSMYVKHSYKNGKNFTEMVRFLFEQDIKKTKDNQKK